MRVAEQAKRDGWELMGHASRFEGVLHWNGEQILDWYMSARAGRHGRG